MIRRSIQLVCDWLRTNSTSDLIQNLPLEDIGGGSGVYLGEDGLVTLKLLSHRKKRIVEVPFRLIFHGGSISGQVELETYMDGSKGDLYHFWPEGPFGEEQMSEGRFRPFCQSIEKKITRLLS